VESFFRPDLLAGRTALITGGATGLGLEIAHLLGEHGATVAICSRKEDNLRAAVDQLTEAGIDAMYTVCDVRRPDEVAATVDAVVERHGGIDVLVNNAAGNFPAAITDISPNGFKAVVDIDLLGTFNVSKAVYEATMHERGGSIVNITADFWNGMPGMGHTGAARAGMDNFTKTAAYEWGFCGVRVNAVAPGWIMSSGMDTYPESHQAVLKRLRGAVPLKRLGHEAEVSSVICFLLSDAAAFISGTNIRIDGAASTGNVATWDLPPAQRTQAWTGFHREVIPNIFKNDDN